MLPVADAKVRECIGLSTMPTPRSGRPVTVGCRLVVRPPRAPSGGRRSSRDWAGLRSARWRRRRLGLPVGRLGVLPAAAALLASTAEAQSRERSAVTLLVPARVFDGSGPRAHEGWAVLVRGERVEAVGRRAELRIPAEAATSELPGTTLIPGLIDAHSHLLRHPYNETSWEDQVLREPGTEGAGYADVGLKQAAIKGSSPARACSPRLGQSLPPGARGQRASTRTSASRRGRRRPTTSTVSRAWCATRSARARTGSRCTPITAGACAARRDRR